MSLRNLQRGTARLNNGLIMFGLTVSHRYYFYNNPTDMRKGFSGLSGLVENELLQSPLNGSVYIFINKPRNKIKLLHWDGSSFVLYYKRLESGTFELPEPEQPIKSISLSYSQLFLLIEGISLANSTQRKRYKNPVIST